MFRQMEMAIRSDSTISGSGFTTLTAVGGGGGGGQKGTTSTAAELAGGSGGGGTGYNNSGTVTGPGGNATSGQGNAEVPEAMDQVLVAEAALVKLEVIIMIPDPPIERRRRPRI